MITKIPFTEILKSVPGFFGIRLEEQPKYEVVETFEDVEIRKYAPALLARLTVPGEFDTAVDQAFDRLARYIFGENSREARMAMTSPVQQQPADSERMAMTSPVVERQDGDGWTLAFFLSNDLNTSGAPKPDDRAIDLVHEPERMVAALTYRGNNTEAKREDSRKRLLATLARHPRWRVDEAVYWAQYDAPFTLPFCKKNEAMVEVEPREREMLEGVGP